MQKQKLRPWVGKTYKRAYTGSKAVDSTCRNHGSCPWCARKRAFKLRKGLVNTY